MSEHCRSNRCAWWNWEAREQLLFGFPCNSAVEDYGGSDAGRDARPRPGPHSRIRSGDGLDKSSGPFHFHGMTEISMRDRVGEAGQLPFHSTQEVVEQHAN